MTMPETGSAVPEPHPALVPLATTARVIRTPCGAGAMVWRAWGAGEPIVLLHGGSGSWRHWARNIEALARDRLVVAADLPGLGESAMPEGPIDPGIVAAIVAQGLDSVLGLGRRFDLVGFSFGAMIAGHVAARLGSQIRSLTVVGPGALGLPRSPVTLVKVREKTGAERVAAHRANLAALMIHDQSRIDELALAIQEWNTVHARLRSRGFATTTSLRDALERTVAPVNAIWGDHDAVAFPHIQERLDLIRTLKPGADVRAIEGAGHWVAYEAPDRFNAMLADMLARRANAP